MNITMSRKKKRTGQPGHTASAAPSRIASSATKSHAVQAVSAGPLVPVATLCDAVEQLVLDDSVGVVDIAENGTEDGTPVEQLVIFVLDVSDPTGQKIVRRAIGNQVPYRTGFVTLAYRESSSLQFLLGPPETAKGFFASTLAGFWRVVVITHGHWYPMHLGFRHRGTA
jgi:hypothetical protein